MIRREGHRIYSVSGTEEGIYEATLCGMTACYARGGVIINLRAHDLDVAVTAVEKLVDASDGIERNSPSHLDISLCFTKGCEQALASWHRHLIAYRRATRPVREHIAA